MPSSPLLALNDSISHSSAADQPPVPLPGDTLSPPSLFHDSPDFSGSQLAYSSEPDMAMTEDPREKERKLFHSAIERRRRQRINEKIMQLKRLIPHCAQRDDMHKMSILECAIDYITQLKDTVRTLDRDGRNRLGGRHLRVVRGRSMLPKEVEPFIGQFSIRPSHQRKTDTKAKQKPLTFKHHTPVHPHSTSPESRPMRVDYLLS